MTKKHFEALADALAMSRPVADDDGLYIQRRRSIQWGADVAAVADVCARFNGNFDRGRFLAACRERFS